jgi:hypothetical protein
MYKHRIIRVVAYGYHKWHINPKPELVRKDWYFRVVDNKLQSRLVWDPGEYSWNLLDGDGGKEERIQLL